MLSRRHQVILKALFDFLIVIVNQIKKHSKIVSPHLIWKPFSINDFLIVNITWSFFMLLLVITISFSDLWRLFTLVMLILIFLLLGIWFISIVISLIWLLIFLRVFMRYPLRALFSLRWFRWVSSRWSRRLTTIVVKVRLARHFFIVVFFPAIARRPHHTWSARRSLQPAIQVIIAVILLVVVAFPIIIPLALIVLYSLVFGERLAPSIVSSTLIPSSIASMLLGGRVAFLLVLFSVWILWGTNILVRHASPWILVDWTTDRTHWSVTCKRSTRCLSLHLVPILIVVYKNASTIALPAIVHVLLVIEVILPNRRGTWRLLSKSITIYVSVRSNIQLASFRSLMSTTARNERHLASHVVDFWLLLGLGGEFLPLHGIYHVVIVSGKRSISSGTRLVRNQILTMATSNETSILKESILWLVYWVWKLHPWTIHIKLEIGCAIEFIGSRHSSKTLCFDAFVLRLLIVHFIPWVTLEWS